MSSACVPLSWRLQKEPVACPQCGSGSRVKRGLCLSCLLSQGLPAEISTDTNQNSMCRKAEAADHLDHPNILPIYEVGQCEDELPFFSMKFAASGSLVEAAPALRSEPRRAAALMARVARAVQYAHVRGILHRDLKPANILLDGHGEPLVSDFGLATWLDGVRDLTHSLTIFGTPGYIAP